MLVFGGQLAAGVANDTWQLSLAPTLAWSQRTPSGSLPSARFGHSATFDPAHGLMLVFGGSVGDGWGRDDLWALNVGGTLDAPAAHASTLHLGPAIPNPSSVGSRVDLALPQAMRVRAALFDLTGRRVRDLADSRLEAGAHSIAWDGRDARGLSVRAGLYFYRVVVGGEVLSRKVVIGR